MNCMLCILLFLIGVLAIPSHAVCEYAGRTAPASGACTGPMQRVEARRSAVASVNRGCAIDQTFFSVDRNYSRISCGQCIPGTAGNWRFYGISPLIWSTNRPVQTCNSNGECSGPSVSALSPAYFCNANEYCDDSGYCKLVTLSPLFGKQCTSTKGKYQSRDEACGPGLFCLQGRCSVCTESTQHNRIIDLLSPQPQGFHLREPVMCIDGLLTTSQWNRALRLRDPRATLIGSFVLIFFIAFLIESSSVRYYYAVGIHKLLRIGYDPKKQNIVNLCGRRIPRPLRGLVLKIIPPLPVAYVERQNRITERKRAHQLIANQAESTMMRHMISHSNSLMNNNKRMANNNSNHAHNPVARPQINAPQNIRVLPMRRNQPVQPQEQQQKQKPSRPTPHPLPSKKSSSKRPSAQPLLKDYSSSSSNNSEFDDVIFERQSRSSQNPKKHVHSSASAAPRPSASNPRNSQRNSKDDEEKRRSRQSKQKQEQYVEGVGLGVQKEEAEFAEQVRKTVALRERRHLSQIRELEVVAADGYNERKKKEREDIDEAEQEDDGDESLDDEDESSPLASNSKSLSRGKASAEAESESGERRNRR